METSYFDAARQPVASTDKTFRWTKTYDDRGNVRRWDFTDADGKLTLGTGGFAAIESEYDARDKETRKTYLGTDGRPVIAGIGYAAIRHAYTPAGQDARTDYLDARGEPMLCESGFCSLSSEYNAEGQLRANVWTGLPGLTCEATTTASYVNGLSRVERYLDAKGQPVNSAYGYARMVKDYDDAGALIRIAYYDAADRPAYGLMGFTKAEFVDRMLRYYDAAGKVMRDNDHRSTRPLLFVGFLRSADSVATRAGVQPGDLIWQIGDFSLPREVAAGWLQHNDDEGARKVLNASWKVALAPPGAGAVHVVVIRQGQKVELDLPSTPAGGVGVFLNFRRVPTFEYDAMVARYGTPSPAPTEPGAAANAGAGMP